MINHPKCRYHSFVNRGILVFCMPFYVLIFTFLSSYTYNFYLQIVDKVLPVHASSTITLLILLDPLGRKLVSALSIPFFLGF